MAIVARVARLDLLDSLFKPGQAFSISSASRGELREWRRLRLQTRYTAW